MESNSEMSEIFIKYARPVRLYVLSICKNADIADDITSETFLKAIVNIDKFKSGNILTWLCTIAKNTYYDYAKKKEHSNIALSDECMAEAAGAAPTPEEALIKKDDRLILYQTMQNLSAESREVVYLRMFAELSFREIGCILGKSENWARIVFYRSKSKMKGMIDNEK